MSPLMLSLRDYTAPVLAAELFAIVVALREGLLRSQTFLRLPTPAMAALVTLAVIASATAAIVAPAPYAAASRTIFWLVHLLFGFAVAHLCLRQFGPTDLIRMYLWGFAALTFTFIVWAVGAVHRPINWTWDIPSFAHIRHPGIYATPMIALCIGIMATARRRLTWAGGFLIATAGLGLALWTGSRGPIAAIAAALLLGAVVAPSLRRPKPWAGILTALALAYVVVALLPIPADNMGPARTISATTESGNMLTGRTRLWILVLDAIRQQPFFGYGEGQMRAVAPFGSMAQPHNIVLQVLLAWGVIGLLCVGVLAYYFCRMVLRIIGTDEATVLPPLLAMLSLLALSMLDAALYHILPVSIFAACAGMIAEKAVSRSDKPQTAGG